MAEYDPEIIEEYAERLYNKALGIQIFMTMLCGAVGIGVGWALGSIGLAIGRSMAFQYKLQAQVAMCQVQIEMNTRATEKSEAAGAR